MEKIACNLRIPLLRRIARDSPGLSEPLDHPDRAISTGGSTTIVGRIIAEKMGDVLGQPVVVDNRGGAAGTLGARQVAASAPDGYTILLGYSGTLSVAPSFYPQVGYDVRKDFAPIGRIGAAPSTLTVHPSFPAENFAEFVAYARTNPGKVNYGSAGVGSLYHIAGEYLAVKTGLKIVQSLLGQWFGAE
jgi:tripartite-type tricarboxylate transporter receptor subunit TctC